MREFNSDNNIGSFAMYIPLRQSYVDAYLQCFHLLFEQLSLFVGMGS